MTLEALSCLVETYRHREFIVISAEEWRNALLCIGPWSIVAGTRDQPPFFWFLDKKIVTPAYLRAMGLQCRTEVDSDRAG